MNSWFIQRKRRWSDPRSDPSAWFQIRSRFFWNSSLNNCIEVHTKKAFLTLSLLAMATIFTNMVFQMAKYGFPHGQIYSQIWQIWLGDILPWDVFPWVTFLKVARICQKLPTVAKSWQQLPKVANSYQQLPKVTKSCQKLPKIAKNCQKLPKMVKNGQKWSKCPKQVKNDR